MNALEALTAGTRGVAAFKIRDTLADTSLSFNDAIEKLAYEPLIVLSDCWRGGANGGCRHNSKSYRSPRYLESGFI